MSCSWLPFPVPCQSFRINTVAVGIKAFFCTERRKLWRSQSVLVVFHQISSRSLQANFVTMREKVKPEEFRSVFLEMLRKRRSEVPFRVEEGKPVMDPIYQATPDMLKGTEAMRACPRNEVGEDFFEEENLYLYTEAGEQGKVPLLLLKSKAKKKERSPAIVVLHSSYKCKEWLKPLLEAYASRGYVAVAIDSRYHGERAKSSKYYKDALVAAWKTGETMPFIYDTVWDLIKLADYLSKRDDIDPCRIGITGESLGGMHAWFAAAADARYGVVVPIIGLQAFKWALDNDAWQARVDSIKPVFEEASSDLGKDKIDREVVEKAWDRIAPGLAHQFDAPFSLPVIAPRPLLVLNGEDDPRCPVKGLEVPIDNTNKAYEEAQVPKNFKFIAEPGIPHRMTPEMVKKASEWFDRFLL